MDSSPQMAAVTLIRQRGIGKTVAENGSALFQRRTNDVVKMFDARAA